jgi:hypothetical protein
MKGKGIAEFNSPPLLMSKVSRLDWKFVKVDPDPNFNPKHNRRVIDEVIRDTDLLARQKKREFAEGLGERSNAIAQFISSINLGGREEAAEKYFGKQYLDHLKGKEKRAENQSKDGLTVVGKDGKIIRRPYEVTLN